MRAFAAVLAGLVWSAEGSAQVTGLTQAAVPDYWFFADNAGSAYERWDGIRSTIEAGPDHDAWKRPVLTGRHARELEQLQDYYMRNFPNASNGGLRSAATQKIAHASDVELGLLRGYLAEAEFLRNHPEWRYSSKPNSRQVDVTRKQPDGRPGIHGAQVKYHVKNIPSLYARELRRYPRVQVFAVPDDHVDSLKDYLRANGRGREIWKVKGIGTAAGKVQRGVESARSAARLLVDNGYPQSGGKLVPGSPGRLVPPVLARAAPIPRPLTTPDLPKLAASRTLMPLPRAGGALAVVIVGADAMNAIFSEYHTVADALGNREFWNDRGLSTIAVGASLVACNYVGAASTLIATPAAGVPVTLVCTLALGPVTIFIADYIKLVLSEDEQRAQKLARYDAVRGELSWELKMLSQMPIPPSVKKVESF